MLDTQGNRNTLNLGDNFCSSSVTIVTRRLLSDTLYYIILSILHYTIQHTERMHCMLDTQGNRNTLNLGDNFCSSSVTIVTRRFLSVTLYYIILSILHCLSFYVSKQTCKEKFRNFIKHCHLQIYK